MTVSEETGTALQSSHYILSLMGWLRFSRNPMPAYALSSENLRHRFGYPFQDGYKMGKLKVKEIDKFSSAQKAK
jgi:hypothetical protein